MKFNKQKREFSIRYGGSLGNFVIKYDHKMSGTVTDEMIEDKQDTIYFYCNMGSNYLLNEFLKKDNDHGLDQLGINLKRFVEDEDYYYHIFENQRVGYDIIIKWFGDQISDLWEQIKDFSFPRNGEVEINDYDHRFDFFLDVLDWNWKHYFPNEKNFDDDDGWDRLEKKVSENSEIDIKQSCTNIDKRSNSWGLKVNELSNSLEMV